MRESWRPNRTAIYWPPLLWPSALCLSLSPGLLNQRPGGPALCWMMAFSTASCLWLIWSPTHWLPVTPSYIIVQSPTQSLEWHVWSSSSGNNCHAVHRSLSSGASVYECTMGFYLVPYFQPSPPTRFLLITAIGMCHFLPVHHFGMACLAGSKVSIQQCNLKGFSQPIFPNFQLSSKVSAEENNPPIFDRNYTSLLSFSVIPALNFLWQRRHLKRKMIHPTLIKQMYFLSFFIITSNLMLRTNHQSSLELLLYFSELRTFET